MHNCAPFTCDNERKMLFISYWQPVIKHNAITLFCFQTLFLAQTTSENCDQTYVQQMWFLITTDFQQKKNKKIQIVCKQFYLLIFPAHVLCCDEICCIHTCPSEYLTSVTSSYIFAWNKKYGHFSSGKCKLDSVYKATGASCHAGIYFKTISFWIKSPNTQMFVFFILP